MVNLVTTLTSVFERGIHSAFPDVSVAVVVTPAAQEKFGDYQCNNAMNIAQVVPIVYSVHNVLLYESFGCWHCEEFDAKVAMVVPTGVS